MKKLQRLKLYIKAYIDYYRAEKWSYNKIMERHLDAGLCWYFYMNGGIDVYGSAIEKYLPELYAQRPNERVGAYWFKMGDLKPRRECLRKAIIKTIFK